MGKVDPEEGDGRMKRGGVRTIRGQDM